MSGKPFHLAWFLQGSSIQAWGAPWTGNIAEDWMDASMFIDIARSMERAGFDYLLLEDSIYVGQNWQNSRDIFLKNGMSIPRQEPSVIATLLLIVTYTMQMLIVVTLAYLALIPLSVRRFLAYQAADDAAAAQVVEGQEETPSAPSGGH